MPPRDAASHRLESRVVAYVAENAVLRPGERVLLMLSGGADSMALLEMLPVVSARLGLDLALEALHVDYATRGEASDRDREIVRRACAEAGVPLHVLRLRRKLEGGDFQARARELRYRRATTIAAERGCGIIATAHNRDDQAETILYRLTKYASPRGLVGMRPRDSRLARPLLCLAAAEIRAFCRTRGIDYGDDATNATPVYARNRLRLEVLPRLAELNPRVAETLAATAAQAAAEADVLAAAVAAAKARVVVSGGGAPAHGAGIARDGAAGELVTVDAAALAAEPPALRALILHDLVREAMGGEALVERRLVEALERLLVGRAGSGRVSLGRGLEAVRGRGRLVVRRARAGHACAPVVIEGAALVAAGVDGVAVDFCGHCYRARLLPGATLDRAAVKAGDACIGLAGPPRHLIVRHPRRGDRFAPLGLGAETTVARFLAAAFVPADERSRALVVEADEVVAWVGYAAARGRVGRVAQSRGVEESTLCTVSIVREGP